jgi:hypothetical protein
MTTTTQSRRPTYGPLHGSAFGSNPLPQTGYEPFDKATAEGARRQKLLLDTQAKLAALQAERDVYRRERDDVLADIVRGIASDDEMPPDREQEFIVSESDLERRIEIASQACREQDEVVMQIAVEQSIELAEAAEATTAPLRAKARKTAARLQGELDALRRAEAVQRWLAQLAQDDLQLFRPAHPDTTLSNLHLEDPVDVRSLLERAHAAISAIGADRVLYSMEIASAPENVNKIHPAVVAQEAGVPLEVLRRALHEQRQGLRREEQKERDAEVQAERLEAGRRRREDWLGHSA